MDENYSKIMEQDSEVVSFQFLQRNQTKIFFYYVGLVLTLGILYLPFYWFEHLNYIFYDEVGEENSTHVLFRNKSDQSFLIQINYQYDRISPYENQQHVKYIIYNKIKYWWSNDEKMWINIEKIYTNFVCKNPFVDCIQPLEQQKADELLKFYGPNSIKIKPKSNFNLFIDELLRPLNVYEQTLILICILLKKWVFIFSLTLVVISQIILGIYFYKKKIKKINSIADVKQDCFVLRMINGKKKKLQVKSSQLCIGDIMLAQPKQKFTCDGLVIKGACLINQAVLTGESIPVYKQKVQKGKNIESSNKILSGSQCIVLKTDEVQVLILSTSWNTYKGRLVGKISQQKQKKFRFYYELQFFIILVAACHVILCLYQFIYSLNSEPITMKQNIMVTIQIIYDSFSPILFFILTTIQYFISFRLEEKQITAINTQKIQECGRVKNICFDKTGTLTTNDIEIFGLALMNKNKLQEAFDDPKLIQDFDNYKIILQLLSCCQSLHVIDKQIIGDPIEEQMFKMTNFKLIEENMYTYENKSEIQDEDENQEENIENKKNIEQQDLCIKIVPNKVFLQQCNQPNNYYLKVIRNIEFTSERKRMSTIINNIEYVENIDDNKIQEGEQQQQQQQEKYLLLTKGAPEVMKQLFNNDSIPSDYSQQVQEFSEQGLRLLAMGYRKINDIEQNEEDLEQNMQFLGFILLDNKIKKETEGVIKTLRKNDVECAMITGDNIYTGISIGYQSGILEKNKDIWVGEFNQQSRKIKWIQYNNMDQNGLNFSYSKKIKSTNILQESIFQSRISQVKSHIGIQKFNYVKESLQNDQTILALEGSAFEKLMDNFGSDEQIRELILNKTRIYGRAIPHQKQLIIQMLKKMYEKQDYCVGFVGDGSNDAKALNEANMGLSIGNSDSSLTASFTTTIDNIYPCIRLLREGKLILDNSIQIYKFSVYEGFSSTFVIFLLAIYETNYHYIYFVIEFLIFMPIYIFCANSRPAKLNPLYPEVSLKTKEFIVTLFAPLLTIMTLLTLLAILIFNKQEAKGRQDIVVDADLNHNFISTAIFFLFNNISQSIMMIAYNKSRPFKKGAFDNKQMLSYIFICNFVLFFMTFHFLIEDSWIGVFMLRQLYLPDFMNYFSLKIFIFLVMSTFINFTFVCILNAYFLTQKIQQREVLNEKKKKQFKVESEKWSVEEKSN